MLTMPLCLCCAQWIPGIPAQLLLCMKEVIGASKDAGFNIAASVCDGGSSNQSAINTILCDTTKLKGEDHITNISFAFKNVYIPDISLNNY